MSFFGTQFFKDVDGVEVAFGQQIHWQVMRQMQDPEGPIVQQTQYTSRFVLYVVGVCIFILILTCGPLLPVWMFINSMQLILHVILIKSFIPGHAHYFLLDYLNIWRLHFFGINSWLREEFFIEELQMDVQLVASDDQAYYYTNLLYSCGYSFSLLPNLVIILALMCIILLIWLMLFICD